ncbi:hypothetical protein EDB92DRAFT_1826676 [Lactarius akahatsu]|uniref:Uncharacterized protein n=1 Tax=Lactarius akahatsu TaxID=416441 RepID=A0AAD4QI84_9AGAM|nr:hypothetical protein EDB92DRAFT_1826676 [Lactarius akahatsu]
MSMASAFSPTQGEAALVNQIFNKHDPQKFGVITGDVAVKVFGGANLNATTLGQIWGIADAENQGFLTRKGVSIAVRLLGWAQKGDAISADLVNKPGPLAVIDGFPSPSEPRRAISPSPQSPGSRLPPPLTAQDKAKFVRLFNGCGPVNGLLSGEKAREVFVKSKLPVEKLSQIWNLSDTHNRGTLDVTDFTVAMYLIQASMSGQLSFIPTTLPPGLYEMASGSSGSAVASHTTGNSGSFSPGLSSTFPQNNGSSVVRQQLTGKPLQPQYSGQPLQQQFTGPALQQHQTGPTKLPRNAPAPGPFAAASAAQTQPAWDVTPSEKANADKFFDTLDVHKRGYIEGDVAVPFMIDSKLPEDDLALIWDLADLNNDGRLTREGFAVAMHLIIGKLAGKDLPSTLPLSLMPPSMRTAAVPPTSPFHPPPSESLKDLIWDDSPTSPVASQPQSILQPQRTGPLSPQSSFSPPQATVPQSSGRGVFGLPGISCSTMTMTVATGAPSIGNLQNQLQSTTRSLENTKTERSTVEATVQDQAAQLSTLQTQLSLAKAAYETESRLLSTLRERFSNQTSQIQKAREELIRAESDLSAIRVEKAEVEQGLMRDKEEVRELQRKMTETGSVIEQVKAEIEKAKKDAKQQKGLLAIAKKQLSTREAEKSKISQELQDAVAEAEAITRELESAEAELAAEPTVATGSNGLPLTSSPSLSGDSVTFAATQPLPGTPGSPSSISGSLGPKSNNPFELRLAAGSGSRSQSPFLPFADPSIPTPAGATPVPNEGTTTDNTFNFDQVFGGGEEVRRAPDVDDLPTSPEEDLSLSTPKIGGELQAITNEDLSPPSSDQDLFSTPPMSALDALGAGAQSPSGEPDVLKLPPAGVPSAPPSIDQPPGTHTDINTSLQRARSPASNGHASPQTGFEASFVPLTAVVTSSKATDAQSTNPFPPAPTQNASPFAAATSPFGVSLDSAKVAGGFPGAEPVATENKFTSDLGFDAEFDFGASVSPPVVAVSPSGSTAFPPPPTSSSGITKSSSSPPAGSGFETTFIPQQVTTSSAPAASAVDGLPTLPPVVESKPFSFEDAFSSSLSPVTVAATPAAPGQPRPSADVPPSLSFESAFGSNTTQGESGFKTTSSRTSSVPQATESPSTLSTFTPSSPIHGPTSPHDTVSFPLSPPREASPPPRVASPKVRTSTSSSRESGDKGKDQGRHSKLSIRLPGFGKRKKTQDTQPPSQLSQQHLAPIVDENVRRTSPAVDDDVEPVKQLCSMGFSRTQAVAALEANSYDFQRALNSLLSSA